MTFSFLHLIIYRECIFLYKFLVPIECQVCQTAFLFWDNEQLWYSSFWGVDHQDITEERENHSEEAAKQKMYAVGCYQQSSKTQYPNMSMSSSVMQQCVKWTRPPFSHSTIIQKRTLGGALIILPSGCWLPTRLNFAPALRCIKSYLL